MLASVGWREHQAGPPTQQQVADQAGADRMMTSRVVRTLQDGGLLTRQPHERSPQARRLSLTDAGRALVRQATQVARDLDVLLFGDSPAELRGELRRIAEHRTATRTGRSPT